MGRGLKTFISKIEGVGSRYRRPVATQSKPGRILFRLVLLAGRKSDVCTQIPNPSKEFVVNRVTMRFQLILPLQGTYGVTAGAGGTMKFAW